MILQQPLNAILQCITNHAFQAEKGRSDRAKHRLHKSIQLDRGLVWPAALDVSRGKRAQLIGNRPAYGKGISFRVRPTHDLFSIFLFLLYLRTRTCRGPFFQTFVFFPTTCSIPPPYPSPVPVAKIQERFPGVASLAPVPSSSTGLHAGRRPRRPT